jgi:hypothetical protein
MVEDRSLPRVVWLPVAVVGAVMVALLVATIDRYGYHRDELYFRVLAGHPVTGLDVRLPYWATTGRAVSAREGLGSRG